MFNNYVITFFEECIARSLNLKSQGDRALAQVSDEDFFREPIKDSNSLAVIVKHLAGNLNSRWKDFLTSDGEKGTRERDSEFVIFEKDSRPMLMEQWELGWQTMLSSLKNLDSENISTIVKIRGEDHTVQQAVLRGLTHAAMHVGQIVYLARYFAGDNWQTLSIERGKSKEFNAKLGYGS